MKVIINAKHGGFGLSNKAIARYKELIDVEIDKHGMLISGDYIERHDSILVQVVKELGNEANADYAELKIVEIPDDVKYAIVEHDGVEHIAEVHRTWP